MHLRLGENMKRKLNIRNTEENEANVHKSSNTIEHHRKIAKNRGAKWRSNMLQGRLRVELNPSRIRMLRLKKLIHQIDVANKLGYTLATYGAIERGLRLVKKEKAQRIANFYGQKLEGLFKPQNDKFIAILTA
jgi:DNA-binding XRE family transcriptional regulator